MESLEFTFFSFSLCMVFFSLSFFFVSQERCRKKIKHMLKTDYRRHVRCAESVWGWNRLFSALFILRRNAMKRTKRDKIMKPLLNIKNMDKFTSKRLLFTIIMKIIEKLWLKLPKCLPLQSTIRIIQMATNFRIDFNFFFIFLWLW